MLVMRNRLTMPDRTRLAVSKDYDDPEFVTDFDLPQARTKPEPLNHEHPDSIFTDIKKLFRDELLNPLYGPVSLRFD